MPLQIRRGTQAEREDLVSGYVPLAPGEPLFTTDEGNLYIGDGTTAGGIHVNAPQIFNFATYTGQIGSIEKDPIGSPGTKSPFITLTDNLTAAIDLEKTVTTNITPKTNENRNLGENNFRFKGIYLGGGDRLIPNSGGIYLGEARIVANGTLVDLPAGSTVGGNPISIVEDGNYKINIVGADSTVIVNSDTLAINADRVLTNFLGSSDGVTDLISIGESSSPVDLSVSLKDSFNISSIIAKSTSFNAFRGTALAKQAVLSSDVLHDITFFGYDGANPTLSAGMRIVVDNDPISPLGTQNVPGKFIFNLLENGVAGIGLGTFKSFSFDSKGRMAVNKFNATANLDVVGDAKISESLTAASLTATSFVKFPVYSNPTTRNTALPNGTVQAGMVVFLTDSTGSGGAPKLQANTDGTTSGWVDL